MAKEYAIPFYNSIAWQRCREGFIAERRMIDGGMCQQCHERLGYIVHHKIELSPDNIHDPTVALCYDNLEYVCHECHNRTHDVLERGRHRGRTIFDAEGNCIANPYAPDEKTARGC